MKARIVVPALFAAIALTGCDSKTSTAPLTRVDGIASITHGDFDGNGHPGVVGIFFQETGATGNSGFICSATLLSPTVILTAGHCTGEPGEFDNYLVLVGNDFSHLQAIIPASGHASHPAFTEAAFFLHDVGVVTVGGTGIPTSLVPSSAYGTLPTAGQLDALVPSVRTTFTTVGYGDQKINPSREDFSGLRMVAEPRLLNINDKKTGTFSLLLSNNAATGGTCFGDSGGPSFLGSSQTIAAVTSFAVSGNCTGNGGGAFRLDKQDVLDFVNGFLHP